MSIYHLAKSEVVPQDEIADRFNVTAATVSDIKLGRRWGHITQKQAEQVQWYEEELGRYRRERARTYKENAHLREALQEIASPDEWETVDEARNIARAALKGESP